MSRNIWSISIGVCLLGLAAGIGACRAAPVDLPRSAPPVSAAVLYNRGNAYARAGQPALAVLSYERASLLAPRDPDIRANLRQVRNSAGLPTSGSGWQHTLRLTNPNTLYWLGLAGLLLSGGGLLLRRPQSRHRLALGVAAGAGLTLTALALGDAVATAQLLHEAVVMQPAAASASPIAGADALFTVPRAAVVEVRDQHRDFVLIHDSQGRDGWIARRNLISIIKPAGDVNEET